MFTPVGFDWPDDHVHFAQPLPEWQLVVAIVMVEASNQPLEVMLLVSKPSCNKTVPEGGLVTVLLTVTVIEDDVV